MKKRSLERFYESDKSHCISLLHPSPLPPPLLAHWKLSSRPITGRLFYSNEARVMALVSPLPPVEWSQCRKSHDHRWKITRNPVCWNLTVITVSLCGRRSAFRRGWLTFFQQSKSIIELFIFQHSVGNCFK